MMARLEIDREDLLAEATALVERVELQVRGLAEPAVIGFRTQGAASIYFGAEPAYHFNASGELRRAYCDGLLYKAERGRLVALDRRRANGEVTLVRRELDDAEQSAFLGRMQADLRQLRERFNAGEFEVRGEVPPGGHVAERARRWLNELKWPLRTAMRPNVGA